MNPTLPSIPTPDVLAAIAPRSTPVRATDTALAAGAARTEVTGSGGRAAAGGDGEQADFAARLANEMQPESAEKSAPRDRRAAHARGRETPRDRADAVRATPDARSDAEPAREAGDADACRADSRESIEDAGGDEPPPGGKELPPWLAAELLSPRPAPVTTQPPGTLDVDPVTVPTPETSAPAPARAALAVLPESELPGDPTPAEVANTTASAVAVDPELAATPAASPALAAAVDREAAAAPAPPATPLPTATEPTVRRAVPETASEVARLLAQARAGERPAAPPAGEAPPTACPLPESAPPQDANPVARPATVVLPAVAANAAPVRRGFTFGVGGAEAAAPPATPPRAEAAGPLAPPLGPAPAAPLPAPSPAPAPLQLGTPLGAPEWPQQLGERVNWLVSQDLTNAHLKLTPAHLGPIEIRISVSEDQANVWFGTHSHVTREALEAAAPRLRDMLGAQGYAQVNVAVNVDVSQQAFRDRSQSSPRYEPAAALARDAEPAAPATSTGARAGAARTRLDAYA